MVTSRFRSAEWNRSGKCRLKPRQCKHFCQQIGQHAVNNVVNNPDIIGQHTVNILEIASLLFANFAYDDRQA